MNSRQPTTRTLNPLRCTRRVDIESTPTDNDIRVFLALYAAERLDAAYLMQAGRAMIAAVIVFVGAVAVLLGQVHNALVTLMVPIPALGLLVVYVVNGVNLGIRDVSACTLETLLHRATSEYLPNWTIADVAESSHNPEKGPSAWPDEIKTLDKKHFSTPSTPLREIAIGLNATEHFYNFGRANKRHTWYLRIYALFMAVLVLLGALIMLFYGLHEAFSDHQAANWKYGQWAILWIEVTLIIALPTMYVWAWISGKKHKERTEAAAAILLRRASTCPRRTQGGSDAGVGPRAPQR
jgi:hypothetical protein